MKKKAGTCEAKVIKHVSNLKQLYLARDRPLYIYRYLIEHSDMDEKATTISKSKSKKSKRDRKDSGEESEYGKKKKDKKSKKDKKGMQC